MRKSHTSVYGMLAAGAPPRIALNFTTNKEAASLIMSNTKFERRILCKDFKMTTSLPIAT